MSIFEVQGQGRAIEQLQRAMRAERVAQSYIFHGPEGVGKALSAVQWAKLLLCARPVTRTSEFGPVWDCCDECHECQLVASGGHPDLHIISRSSNKYVKDKSKRDRQLRDLPIDIIREFVIVPAGVQPSRGRARVFVIDEAERMNNQAQNSILKTLEEPPANAYLVLVTSRPDRFLPTIHSRCQSVRFGPLGREFITGKLVEAGASAEAAGYWANFSGGRLGMALNLSGSVLGEVRSDLLSRLSAVDYDTALEMAGWLVDVGKKYGDSLKDETEQSGAENTRDGQILLMEMMIHGFSLALREAAGVDVSGAGERDSVSKLAGRFGSYGASEAIRATARAQGQLYANVNATLLFESLLLEYTSNGR